jgi:hypothetical protein
MGYIGADGLHSSGSVAGGSSPTATGGVSDVRWGGAED